MTLAHDQLMICTCSHIPVYCVYQNTHNFLPSPPLLSSSQEHRSIPLHNAALNGHLDTVKRLVEGGSNIDHQNKVCTLEHVSCDQVYGNVEMLTLELGVELVKPYLIREEVMAIDYTSHCMYVCMMSSMTLCMYTQYHTVWHMWYDV